MKAFPSLLAQSEKEGMDLRDYFAARVIQSLMSNYEYDGNWDVPFFDTANDMAALAYIVADEMMRVRGQ